MSKKPTYEELEQRIQELEQEKSERKLTKKWNTLNMRILDTINKSKAWKDCIEEILGEIKQFTGFEAVAIRLLENEDFPYYVTKGFPAHFVEAERYLCTRDSKGEITRDSEGNPYVECMCGNVICGRTDASKDFFTEGGSFWSNNTSKLLSETTDEDRQTRTRNRCNSEGYESVALFPLKVGYEILGLLQINDTRPHQFTDDTILLFEDIGISVGTAFSRKRAEEQIEASLKEKEVLLREIHHRVKNNMQVIISLLKLQSDKIEDKKYAEMLKESQNRILSMALVHEQLYMSKDFANIDLGEYVKSFVNGLFVSYGVDTNKVKLNVEIKNLSLDLENAIPCGLIINELVSNSLKHAYPRQGEGNISIVLQSTNEDEIELTVSDDGVGIPQDLDIKDTESMGLRLVKVLAEQTLEGKMELNRTEGTQFSFILKRSKYKPRI